MNGLADGRGDVASGRARVPPGPAVDHLVANGHRGPKMNLDPVKRYRVVIEVARQEVPCRNKAPRRVVVFDDDLRSNGGQRRPPDVSIAVAPIHPSRRPEAVRYPDPAKLWVRQPAAIVKGCPTP